MSYKKFDLLVFIGRFRPFHNGHKHVVDMALANAHNVLVLVGSANRPRSRKNPWTSSEVREMIRGAYGWEGSVPRELPLSIELLDDWMHDNDFTWVMYVQRAVDAKVREIQQLTGNQTPLRIGLVGHSKDNTSYYLKKFPQWGSLEVPAFKIEAKPLDATMIRQRLLAAAPEGGRAMTDALHGLRGLMPHEVVEYLRQWVYIPQYIQLMRDLRAAHDFALDYDAEHQYKGKRVIEKDGTTVYMGKPYQPIHTTTDSTFIQSGHVLLGKRKLAPGKDLWALPGGFAKQMEQLSVTSKRESKEETRIGLPPNAIDLAFKFRVPFTDVNRGDDRGRIITFNHVYILNDREDLPTTQAGDDFSETKWWQLGLLDPRWMYSDHYWQIMKVIGMIPVE